MISLIYFYTFLTCQFSSPEPLVSLKRRGLVPQKGDLGDTWIDWLVICDKFWTNSTPDA